MIRQPVATEPVFAIVGGGEGDGPSAGARVPKLFQLGVRQSSHCHNDPGTEQQQPQRESDSLEMVEVYAD